MFSPTQPLGRGTYVIDAAPAGGRRSEIDPAGSTSRRAGPDPERAGVRRCARTKVIPTERVGPVR